MAQIILDSNNNLIQGDFDNATLNNRTKLQTTTTNATTNVYIAPNGSSTSAGVSVANNSSLTNASKIVMATNGTTDTQIISGVNGSGTYLPMSFYTNNALAMQIDTSNNVVVGNASAFGKLTVYQSSLSAIALTVQTQNGNFGSQFGNVSGTANYYPCVFSNNGFTSTIGYISCSGTTTVYSTSSDYRLKEDVAPMLGALDIVAQLKPVTFKWKQDGSDGQGFIAHELQAVLPDAVVGEKDALDAEGKPFYQGVDTSFLVATLTAAIQEQQTIINELKSRIEALESK
jgi:hypothetical protein